MLRCRALSLHASNAPPCLTPNSVFAQSLLTGTTSFRFGGIPPERKKPLPGLLSELAKLPEARPVSKALLPVKKRLRAPPKGTKETRGEAKARAKVRAFVKALHLIVSWAVTPVKDLYLENEVTALSVALLEAMFFDSDGGGNEYKVVHCGASHEDFMRLGVLVRGQVDVKVEKNGRCVFAIEDKRPVMADATPQASLGGYRAQIRSYIFKHSYDGMKYGDPIPQAIMGRMIGCNLALCTASPTREWIKDYVVSNGPGPAMTVDETHDFKTASGWCIGDKVQRDQLFNELAAVYDIIEGTALSAEKVR